ncbi:alpha-amylase family glycosyl hydrolase [Bacillus sp. AK128]
MSRKVVLVLIPFLLFCSQVMAVEKEERSWQDEMVYSITIDRFFNGDANNDINVNIQDPLAYHGGDFQGIIEKLDYIKELGFTAISLSPIVNNDTNGYHGYWPEDFYEVEEHFGTIDEFKQLVEEAHAREMKIMVDLAISHIGESHPWLAEPNQSDWYSREGADGFLVSGLPQLNYENDEVVEYIIDMAKWWVSETKIDGYRLVNAAIPPNEFWERLGTEIQELNEDFILVGDRIEEMDQWGSFSNYEFQKEATETFSEFDQPVDELYQLWEQQLNTGSNINETVNFIDNEQTVRFTRELIEKQQNPETRLKLALTYLYSAPGIPMVYYGTEIALDGGEVPDNHRMMAFRADKVIIDYMKKLAEIRAHHSSLRYGDFEMIFSSENMAVFKRTYEGESIIVALNNSSETIAAEIPEEVIGSNLELRALLTDDVVRANDGMFRLAMDRETSNIFMLHERTGVNWTFIMGMLGVWTLFGLFIWFVKRKSKRVES